jgi:hypothetical protein
MSPNSNPATRELLETRLDALDEGQEQIRQVMLRLEGKVDKTNGRVTNIELREAMAKAAAEEHHRMVAIRDNKNEKWVGIGPTVIASTISGVTVALVLLLVTGTL